MRVNICRGVTCINDNLLSFYTFNHFKFLPYNLPIDFDAVVYIRLYNFLRYFLVICNFFILITYDLFDFI